MKYPKILIISHNPLSNENNMGKTLSRIFSLFPKDNIAQLYFHEGKPTSNVSNNYFSFSDKNAIKSIFLRWNRGTIYRDENFEQNVSKTFNTGVYKFGKRKGPISYFLRDLVWSLSNFKNKHLLQWINNFKPDFVFFASGDSAFAYKNALWICRKHNFKLVTMCFDDYYKNCEYYNSIIGRFYFKHFIKIVNKTIKFSFQLIANNDLMAAEYSELFGIKFNTLFTPAYINKKPIVFENKYGVAYIGGLGLGRDISLLEFGKSLESVNSKKLGKKIFVYSRGITKQQEKVINDSIFLDYCGSLSFDKVDDTISDCYAVIHTESFDPDVVKRTRLSLSTKIAESLCSGTLLVAYGPENIASIDYLIKNNCALVAHNVDELKFKLKEIVEDDEKYFEFINNAYKTAINNHSFETVTKKLLSILQWSVEKNESNSN